MYEKVQALIQALIAMVLSLMTTLSPTSPEYVEKFGGNCAMPANYKASETNNSVINYSFEIDEDKDLIPDYWHLDELQNGDILDCATSHTGLCSMYFSPFTGDWNSYVRRMEQTIPIKGTIGTKISLSGWSKAKQVAEAHESKYARLIYGVQLDFFDENGEYISTPNSDENIKFFPGDHDFQKAEYTFESQVDFSCLQVGFFFLEKGEVWFDDIQVTINPPSILQQ